MRRQVTPEVDIWSLGCIFSEVAVWLALGPPGLQEYRDLRNEYTKEYGLEDSDCFHDGEGILRCVEEFLQKLPDYLPRCDKITEPILTMIKDGMLVPRRHRRPANNIWYLSSQVLRNSSGMMDDHKNHSKPLGISHHTLHLPTSPYPGVRIPEQTATSTSPRQETVPNGQNRRVPPSPLETDFQRTTSQQVQYPWTESPEVTSPDRPAHLRHLSNESSVESMSPLGGVIQDAFSARPIPPSSPAERDLNPASSRRTRVSTGEDTFASTTSQPYASDAEYFLPEPQLGRGHSRNPGLGHSTNHIINSKPKDLHDKIPSMAPRPNLISGQRRTGSETQGRSLDAATRAHYPLNAENSTGQPPHDPYSSSTPTRQHRLPILSFDDAKVWREKRKKNGLRGLAITLGISLGGAKDVHLADNHLIDELKHRNHVRPFFHY